MAKKSNGEGSIYKDKATGSWIAQITWVDRTGKTLRKRWKNKKQSVVKERLREFRRQLLLTQGNIGNRDDILFREYSNYWLTEVLQLKLKPSSYMRKEVTLRNQVWPILGDIPMQQIADTDIRMMIKELQRQGLSYSTIKKAYECVNGCFRYYIINNDVYGFKNPCAGAVMPKNTDAAEEVKHFTKEQREAIVTEATRCYPTGYPIYRMGWAYPLLMYTGLRRGELLALTWKDVDFDNRTITVNKNAVVVKVGDKFQQITQNSTKTKHGERIIPLNNQALKALEEIRKITGDEPYVICTQTHKQLSPRNLTRNFHSILLRAGITTDDETYGVHTLRHTFASMLFQNGCSVKVVSELLGHSNTSITENTYIHLIQKQKIAAVQSIDQFID